jgi:hypothetical protein
LSESFLAVEMILHQGLFHLGSTRNGAKRGAIKTLLGK